MEKNQKLVVFLVSLLLVLGIVLTFALTYYVTSDKGEKKPEEEEQQPPTTEPEDKPDDVSTDSTKEPEEKPKTADQIFKKPVKKNTKIMTERDVRLHETTAREMFRRFEFLEGHEYLTEQVALFSTEGEGQIIQKLHQDSAMLSNLGHEQEEVHEEGHVTDIDGMFAVLSNIEDPEMSLLAMLYVSMPARNELLLSYDSLSPVFDDQVMVFGITEEVDEVLIREINQIYETKSIYHIEFEIDDEQLYAVVIEKPTGFTFVYGIYEVEENSSVFLTVREWMDLEKELKELEQKNNTEKEGVTNNE